MAGKENEKEALAMMVATVNLAIRQGKIGVIAGHLDRGVEEEPHRFLPYADFHMTVHRSNEYEGRLYNTLRDVVVERVGGQFSMPESKDAVSDLRIRVTSQPNLKELADIGVEFPGAELFKTKHLSRIK